MENSLTFSETILLRTMLQSAVSEWSEKRDTLVRHGGYPESVASIERRISDMMGILAKL